MEYVFEIHECQNCGSYIVAFDGSDSFTCHGVPMVHRGTTEPVTHADLRSCLVEKVNIPGKGVDICGPLVQQRLWSTEALSEQTGYTEAAVVRQLDRLVTAELLTEVSLPTEDGGQVRVYHHENGRLPETLGVFCRWAGIAAGDKTEFPLRPTPTEAFVPLFRERGWIEFS